MVNRKDILKLIDKFTFIVAMYLALRRHQIIAMIDQEARAIRVILLLDLGTEVR